MFLPRFRYHVGDLCDSILDNQCFVDKIWIIQINVVVLQINQMLGFSTEDVYDMFNYYKDKGDIPADRDIDAIVDEMKPWYDNYCFSENALDTQSRVFNCDMVIYLFYYGCLPSRELGEPSLFSVSQTTMFASNTMSTFLLPDLTHYATKHCYILELKLVPKREKGESKEKYEARINEQWHEAELQINGYAKAPRVEALRQGTQLHKIIM